MAIDSSSPRTASSTQDDLSRLDFIFDTTQISLDLDSRYHRLPQSENGPDCTPRQSWNNTSNSSANAVRESSFAEDRNSRPAPLAPRYSEIYSPDPELVLQVEKEALQQSQPLVVTGPNTAVEVENRQNSPSRWYKRRRNVLLIVAAVIVLIGVIVGVVLGTRRSHKTDRIASGSADAADTSFSVGGNVDPIFYSESGAFNGSGIAIASTNAGLSNNIYAFYQDFAGSIQYRVMDESGSWRTIGPVNDGSFRAMNGTPLSAVHYRRESNDSLVWHIFYIDQDFMVRERVLTSDDDELQTPYWKDGPLGRQDLKVMEADTIGMQACYWGNYYGDNRKPKSKPKTGIHLWFASSATSVEQYSWTSDTVEWRFDATWNDINGHAGVGCQTWSTGMTEYVFFVGMSNDLALFWRDGNSSARATSQHPINEWTRLEADKLSVTNIHPLSSLGYTNYIAYQAADATIRGLNVIWDAENTRAAESQLTENNLDEWILRDVQTGDPVVAVAGTHLSITALATLSGGSRVTVFFQAVGADVAMYTRDMADTNGLWQSAQHVV